MPMKLSPLSVPYRVLERGGSLLVAAVFVVFSGGAMLEGIVGSLTLVALLGLGVLALVGYQVAYYQRYEYELTADTFDIRSGVFARREREIPLRRIQNVDISRNVVQRVLGIAMVDLETAGGSETEASLRFVSFAEAKRLQREVPRMKRGAEPGTVEEPEPATELFALSDRELALVGLLSFDFRVPGLLALLLSGSVPVASSFLPRVGVAGLAGVVAVLVVGVVLVSWVVGAVVAVLNYYDFHLVRAGDELQYERGLLQRYDGSIPFDKLQTLTVEDTPLKRWFGYATLLIETAGYAPGQSSGGGRGSEAAVPLAERDRVFALANDIDPFGEPDISRPPKRVRRRYAVRYLIVIAVLTGLAFGADAVLGLPFPPVLPLLFLVVVPPAAHLKWLHRGYWLGDEHVVTRNGVLKRQTKVVPYSRIQTIIDTRTVFQRRWNLATVTVDTAGSLSLTSGDAAAVDVDEAVADELRTELDERLRVALAERRRERGARRDGLIDSDDATGTADGPHASVGAVEHDGRPQVPEESESKRQRSNESPERDDAASTPTRRPEDTNGEADDGFVWGGAFDDRENESGAEDETGSGAEDETGSGAEDERVSTDENENGGENEHESESETEADEREADDRPEE
jgi:putative membrane protein